MSHRTLSTSTATSSEVPKTPPPIFDYFSLPINGKNRIHTVAEPEIKDIYPSVHHRKEHKGHGTAHGRSSHRAKSYSHTPPATLAKLLVQEEDETKKTRIQLSETLTLLERQNRRLRTLELENAALETTLLLHRATISHANADFQSEHIAVKTELHSYKLQLEQARAEISRTDENLKALQAQRDAAEASAAKARSVARQLRQEKNQIIAHSQGLQEGFEEGLRHGRMLTYVYEEQRQLTEGPHAFIESTSPAEPNPRSAKNRSRILAPGTRPNSLPVPVAQAPSRVQSPQPPRSRLESRSSNDANVSRQPAPAPRQSTRARSQHVSSHGIASRRSDPAAPSLRASEAPPSRVTNRGSGTRQREPAAVASRNHAPLDTRPPTSSLSRVENIIAHGVPSSSSYHPYPPSPPSSRSSHRRAEPAILPLPAVLVEPPLPYLRMPSPPVPIPPAETRRTQPPQIVQPGEQRTRSDSTMNSPGSHTTSMTGVSSMFDHLTSFPAPNTRGPSDHPRAQRQLSVIPEDSASQLTSIRTPQSSINDPPALASQLPPPVNQTPPLAVRVEEWRNSGDFEPPLSHPPPDPSAPTRQSRPSYLTNNTQYLQPPLFSRHPGQGSDHRHSDANSATNSTWSSIDISVVPPSQPTSLHRTSASPSEMTGFLSPNHTPQLISPAPEPDEDPVIPNDNSTIGSEWTADRGNLVNRMGPPPDVYGNYYYPPQSSTGRSATTPTTPSFALPRPGVPSVNGLPAGFVPQTTTPLTGPNDHKALQGSRWAPPPPQVYGQSQLNSTFPPFTPPQDEVYSSSSRSSYRSRKYPTAVTPPGFAYPLPPSAQTGAVVSIHESDNSSTSSDSTFMSPEPYSSRMNAGTTPSMPYQLFSNSNAVPIPIPPPIIRPSSAASNSSYPSRRDRWDDSRASPSTYHTQPEFRANSPFIPPSPHGYESDPESPPDPLLLANTRANSTSFYQAHPAVVSAGVPPVMQPAYMPSPGRQFYN